MPLAYLSAQEIDASLAKLDAAVNTKTIGPATAENIRRWLIEDRYRHVASQVADHIVEGRWPTLSDVFCRTIPFGTAGRRGRMYPIGTNVINEQTIGETAQGLADYVRWLKPRPSGLRCAVAYDTRHRSLEFADLCCEVMAAAGFVVYHFDAPRGTPELAFTVRAHDCACGIMISASHNPPEDNAIKVFWFDGGQLRPPHDRGVMTCVDAVGSVTRYSIDDARREGRVVLCQAEMDSKFQKAVLKRSHSGERDIKILYSPMHGVGSTCVLPVLADDGFADVECFEPHSAPDGDFPNVPNHIANPENPVVFDAIVRRADEIGADLLLASDPDADRIGCAARRSPGGSWRALTGNQIAVLLADYILRRRGAANSLGPDHYIVKTLVTTEMLRAVANRHKVRILADVFTGFKWIAGVINDIGPEHFVFAAEEAHGYLVGDYVRDKDAAGAAMLLAELAAESKHDGRTLHQVLDQLYAELGYYAEASLSRSFPGEAGMDAMQCAMDQLRAKPPSHLADMQVATVRDYLTDITIRPRLDGRPVEGKECDLLFFDLDHFGYRAAVRPSGTEPKLKFYFFAHRVADATGMTSSVRKEVDRHLAHMSDDLLAAAGLAK